jgi:hypothetical protein
MYIKLCNDQYQLLHVISVEAQDHDQGKKTVALTQAPSDLHVLTERTGDPSQTRNH